MVSPEIVIEPRPEQLAKDVAERTIRVLGAAQRERPLAHLVVTGGSILESVLSEIRESSVRSVDWTRVAVWWGDERFVAADSSDRNDRVACELLFDHVSVAPQNLHRMPSLGSGSLRIGTQRQRLMLPSLPLRLPENSLVPAFDVVLLGMGPDGLVPAVSGNPALRETELPVVAVPTPQSRRRAASSRSLRFNCPSNMGEPQAKLAARAMADPMKFPWRCTRRRTHHLVLDNDAASCFWGWENGQGIAPGAVITEMQKPRLIAASARRYPNF